VVDRRIRNRLVRGMAKAPTRRAGAFACIERSGGPHQFGHLVGIRHEGRAEVADQATATRTRGAGHRARHCRQFPTESMSLAGSIERTGPVSRLHNHGRSADAGDDSVALQKSPASRRTTGREFANH
jgi:hypothetical protein